MTAPAGPKALTRAAFGARGTGKTAWVRKTIDAEKPPRLLVWDFKHDPGLEGIGVPIVSLQQLAIAAKAPAFRLRYMVDHTRNVDDQFRLFCLIAWKAGRLLMFVDELPEVTKANKAPAEWRRCVNVGRDYVDQGERKWLAIMAAGQRMAETDKSFISNCDVLHVGRLANAQDCRELAGMWGIQPAEISGMPDLHFLEKRADQRDLVRGVLSFGVKRARHAANTAKKAAKKATPKKPPLAAPPKA